MKKKLKISIVSLNQELPDTCGSCVHTDNDMGLVALHCDLYYTKKKKPPLADREDGYKVRSWWKACKYYKGGKK